MAWQYLGTKTAKQSTTFPDSFKTKYIMNKNKSEQNFKHPLTRRCSKYLMFIFLISTLSRLDYPLIFCLCFSSDKCRILSYSNSFMTFLFSFGPPHPIPSAGSFIAGFMDNRQVVLFGTWCVWHKDGRFGSKVGQIGPKWDNSGAFSDQISAHFAP